VEAFVTGGSGFVGRFLTAELLARQWKVRALVRTRARAGLLAPEASIVLGELADEGALREGALGADVVFHLAGATSGTWEAHAEATVAGTRRMLRICRDAGVRRFILASSAVVYDKSGQDRNSMFDESAPLLPAAPCTGAYARGKLEAERLVLEHAQRGAMEVVIVRPGLIYGKERLTFAHLGELVGQARIAYGRASLLLPLVEAGSCADALLRLATAPAAAGRIYNIVDAYLTTRRDYLEALRSATGHSQRVIYVPAWPVAAGCAVGAALGRITGSARLADISGEKIRTRSIEVRYDTSALQRDSGWQPLRDFSQGMARTGLLPARGSPRHIARVGIVGAGMIARAHLAALRRIPGVQVTGILDSELAAARALGGEAGIAVFDHADRFYADARPQLVHVLTPPHTHAAIALESLRRGAHVLLEKPAATTLAECDALLEAAAGDNLTIGVDETVAWDPLVRRARSALIHGVLGKLVRVDIYMGCDLSRGGRLQQLLRGAVAWEHRLAGGPLEDLLPHPLAVVRALCGRLELRNWYSHASGRLPVDFPDELHLSLGSNQVSAQIDISLTARPDDFLLTVRGTRATVCVDVQNMLIDFLTPLPGPRPLARGARVLRTAARMLGQAARNSLLLGLRRQLPPASPVHLITEHYAALARGEPPPAPLSEARADLAIARAIWPEPQPLPARTADQRSVAPALAMVAGGVELQCGADG
jgi:nucleoside-diphosphate-sugar epimerase/predicted dehydrogenase